MTKNVFRNGASLLRVLEDAPVELLESFFTQDDDNFEFVRGRLSDLSELSGDADEKRTMIRELLASLSREDARPFEVECRRIIDLSEKGGPASLATIVAQRLLQEEQDVFALQDDSLCKGLWAHAHHRGLFDDATSYNNARAWRGADRLFGRFEIDIDDPVSLLSTSIDNEALQKEIKARLKTDRECSVGVIDLPKGSGHASSIMLIVRFAGEKASIAVHGNGGARKVVYLLPQEEAVLIFTPSERLLEIAGKKADTRKVVIESFAKIILQHDLSARPLTWANYDTSRFRKSLTLELPQVEGATVTSARVVELELRLNSWTGRLALRAGPKDEIAVLAKQYLDPGHALRRSLGFSRLTIEVEILRDDGKEAEVLNIQITERNRSNVTNMADPERRRIARKLLECWKINQPYDDLSADEAVALMPVMADLSEFGEKTVKGSYFIDRNVDPKRLVQAGLIRRKEVEPTVFEADIDPEEDLPLYEDRVVYTIFREWLVERLARTLGTLAGNTSVREVSDDLWSLGETEVGGEAVRIYYARGLGDLRKFLVMDAFLASLDPDAFGIVLSGCETGWPTIGNKPLIFCLEPSAAGTVTSLITIDGVKDKFAAWRLSAPSSGVPELIPVGTERLVLRIAGKKDLYVDGRVPVRAIRLLHKDYLKERVGVLTAELIDGSTYKSVGQIFGPRWPQIVGAYIAKAGRKTWTLIGE
ncbi:MAG: hypothetical protein ACOH2H_07245 [Cypionkella sp.]